MQSFLSPEETGVISPYVVREWLRPMHAWSDGFQEVGAPWEIAKIGREARVYAKGTYRFPTTQPSNAESMVTNKAGISQDITRSSS
jgi:hypothetical protein